jgi:hypothetical protein
MDVLLRVELVRDARRERPGLAATGHECEQEEECESS